jgi:type I restriction enzyme S subunit
MSSEWRLIKVQDLGTIVTGRTPPSGESDYYGEETPFLTPSDFGDLRKVEITGRRLSKTGTDRMSKILVPSGVGISCIGWQMGKAVLIDQPTITNQQINSIIISAEHIDKCFVYYSLSTRRNEFFTLGSGGSRTPILNKTDFGNLDFLLPQVSEQKAIAHILGTLDDKIELNRKTNETLEAMAKALFKSWFVDFDPVRAKAEGRPTGLPAEISDLFPDSFEDSELGEIPSGWKVGCLSDCCEITMGQSPPGDTYNDEGDGLPFYQGKTDFGFRFPGRRIYCSSPTRQASIGATLISVRAPVGSANIAREVCSIGRGIAALKSRQSADSFIYYLIGTLQGVFESYNSEGTVFGAINGKDLASIHIVAPSTEAIAAFNSQCLPMDESIQSNTLETEHLTTIRDTLLPKLISGEIRIPDAEKMLEEVGV